MSSLIVNNLTVSHGAIRALTSVSFEVPQGELAAVIGANGAGKTTLLRTLSGLKSAENGTATWRDRNILGVKPEDLVRRGISHVSEGKSVIPELTVKENLLVGGLWRRNRSDTAKVPCCAKAQRLLQPICEAICCKILSEISFRAMRIISAQNCIPSNLM